MNHKLDSLFGLKFNPFVPEVPLDALYVSPPVENFLWRIENALLREGGFSMVSGIPGQGKSVVMRLLEKRISRLAPNERQIAVIHHPQSNVADFYRELGDHFNIVLKASNRWTSFKALRERWLEYLGQSRRRSIVLIDEAQECSPAVLNELRLMSSHCFDSQMLLCVVLAGDDRLPEKMRRDDLLPLGSRIRMRLILEPQTPEELRTCLDHMLEAAGNAALMTQELRTMLCEHAAGNPRVLMSKAGDLLLAAAKQDLPQLDEKLYYQTFPTSGASVKRRAGAKAST
jgi:type II secretory pathway predicted ATPase ExeA